MKFVNKRFFILWIFIGGLVFLGLKIRIVKNRNDTKFAGERYLGIDIRILQSSNEENIKLKYPDVIVNYNYTNVTRFLRPAFKKNCTNAKISEKSYNRFINLARAKCLNELVISGGDRRWILCIARPYYFDYGCKVYSFNRADNFVIESKISKLSKCKVEIVHPSCHENKSQISTLRCHINSLDYNENGSISFSSFKRSIGHSRKIIDVLKMDLNGDEWNLMKSMLQDFSFSFVKQFCLMAHFSCSGHKLCLNNKVLTILNTIEKQYRFRKYHVNFLNECPISSMHAENNSICCVDMCYINLNYLT